MIVIGGGITGALTAHALVQAGVDTVLVDKRVPGTGSTGATTGLLLYETDVPLYRLVETVGEDRAVRSYRRGAEAISAIGKLARQFPDAAGFRWRGSLYGASRREDVAAIEKEYSMRRRHGFEVELWTRREIGCLTSLPFFSGLATSHAADIDAFQLTQALLTSARPSGLRIYARTKVRSWEATKRGVTVHAHRGHQLRARALVVAAGYEADRLLPGPLTQLHSTYAFVTEPVDHFTGWPDRRVIWETARPYCYWRTTTDRRIMMGGADVPFQNPRLRDALRPLRVRSLRRKFRRYFPDLECRVAQSWAGTFAETRDALPYIGARRGEPNVYYALGYGGNGITFGFIAAGIVRDLCLGQPPRDLELFSFER